MRFQLQSEQTSHHRKQSRIAIRHASDHRVVAVIEIVSAGNKSSKQAIRAFVEKAAELINASIHLLVIDLFPPGPRDPNGIHGEICRSIRIDSPEGLILLKLIAFRPQDQLDIQSLIFSQPGTLDLDWIHREWLTIAHLDDPRMLRFKMWLKGPNTDIDSAPREPNS